MQPIKRVEISLLAWTLLFACCVCSSVHADEFDSESKRIGSARLLSSWYEVVLRSKKEHSQIEDCLEDKSNCTLQMKSLRTLILRGRNLKPRQKLSLANRYINRERRYARDQRSNDESLQRHIDQRQQWSTLLDFLERGGDCEDYATSKYTLLKFLGFKPEDLRILVVYDRNAREHHALMLVNNEELGLHLLDSDNAIYRNRPFHYRYVYSLNEHFIWDHSLERESSAKRLIGKRSN